MSRLELEAWPKTLIEYSIKALVQLVVNISRHQTGNTWYCDAVKEHFAGSIPHQTWIQEKWSYYLLDALEKIKSRPSDICRLGILAFGPHMLRLDLDLSSALRGLPEVLYEGLSLSPSIRSFSSKKETGWTHDCDQLAKLGKALSSLKFLCSLTLNGVSRHDTHFCGFISTVTANCPELREADFSETPFCDECANVLAGNCLKLETILLNNTKLTKRGAAIILLSSANLQKFEAINKNDVSIPSVAFWQLLQEDKSIAAKLKTVEVGHGIEFSLRAHAQILRNIETIVYRNAVNPAVFRLANFFPNLKNVTILYDGIWDLPLIALLPLLEIVLLNGHAYPVAFTFNAVGMLDVMILERLEQFFPQLVSLTLKKPEPNYGEPFSHLIQQRCFRNLQVLDYEGCLYPPHALILLSSCTQLRKLTLYTDILPLATVRTILQSNGMEELEELHLGLQKDLSIEIINLFVDAAPKLRILGRCYWWHAIPEEDVRNFLSKIKAGKWNLEVVY